jgi:hypothetical protein
MVLTRSAAEGGFKAELQNASNRAALLRLDWGLWVELLYLGGVPMVRTILVSKYIQVQGAFVQVLKNGNIIVCTGNGQFEGRPV